MTLYEKLRTTFVIFRPFKWIWPRRDVTVIHTTVYFGPLSLEWENDR